MSLDWGRLRLCARLRDELLALPDVWVLLRTPRRWSCKTVRRVVFERRYTSVLLRRFSRPIMLLSIMAMSLACPSLNNCCSSGR